jgi:periplasmic protein TonB
LQEKSNNKPHILMKAADQKQYPINQQHPVSFRFFKLLRNRGTTANTLKHLTIFQTLSIMKINYNPQNDNSVVSLDDIVFDGRNHAYGAYALRKNHHKYTNVSFLFASSLAIAIIAATFINRHPTPPAINLIEPDVTTVFTTVQTITLPQPPHEITVGQTLINQLTNHPVIVDEVPAGTAPLALTEDFGTGTNSTGTQGTSTNGTFGTIPTDIRNTDDAPFLVVEESAIFHGDFRQWIGKHINYPSDAVAAGVQGKVIIQFVVNKKGKVEDVKILRGIHPDLDMEVARVVASSPLWVPGKQGGNPVRQQFTIPIIFRLSPN